MATLHVAHDALEVRFTTSEKVLGLVRDRSFPLSSVVSVEVADDALAAVRGLRAPGLGLPGLRKVGTWRGRGTSLVSVRRGQQAVVVSLDGQGPDRLVIGVDDPATVVATLGTPTG